jgi:hypothetical protein
MQKSFSSSWPHPGDLVTVPVDYSENNRVLVDELRNRVSAPATA